MALDPGFQEHVEDLLGPLVRGMRTKRMMGGVMIWSDDAAFALITSDNVLYLKADEQTVGEFEAAGVKRFGRMPYWEAPAAAMDDRDELEAWVAKAVAAGRRTAKPKRKR